MFVIGIAGGTCGGKSTLAARLSQIFSHKKTLVINMDRYSKKPSPTTVAPFTGKEYVEHNHPCAIKLGELYEDFNKSISGDADIVIIEGLFALHLKEIREKLDLKVFVDLKSDERLVRRIKRFTQNGQTFEEVTDRYIDTVRFRHDELIEPTRWYADFVINGTLDMHKGIEILKTYIESEI